MAKYTCKHCQKEFKRNGKRKAVFCSIQCKADWQREQKPATKEWLYQKYIVEELGTYEIGNLVNRDAKRVWRWLVDYGIETRNQHDSIVLMNKRKSTREKRRVTSSRPMTQATKDKLSKAKTGKSYPNLAGKNNGMYGRTGKSNPRWKGGTTPERHALYSSLKWKDAIKKVWARDDGYCQRCNKKSNGRNLFHIHHIKSFSDYPELRCEVSNLILFCAKCHHWVHSNKNTEKEFINE